MTARVLSTICLALLGTAAAVAASAATSAAPDPAYLLKPARVFDGTDPKPHEGWTVLVRGDRIESAGGILKAITSGYLQREIAENSYRLSKRGEAGEDSVVGVNKYSVEEEEKPIETLKIDFKAQRRQIQRLKQVKKSRDSAKVRAALDKIARAYESERENSIYPMLEAVAAYGTLGEIIEVGRSAFGEWKEPIIL